MHEDFLGHDNIYLMNIDGEWTQVFPGKEIVIPGYVWEVRPDPEFGFTIHLPVHTPPLADILADELIEALNCCSRFAPPWSTLYEW